MGDLLVLFGTQVDHHWLHFTSLSHGRLVLNWRSLNIKGDQNFEFLLKLALKIAEMYRY